MSSVKLELSQEEFEKLHKAFEGTYGKNIPVPREEFGKMLRDHSVMYAELKNEVKDD